MCKTCAAEPTGYESCGLSWGTTELRTLFFSDPETGIFFQNGQKYNGTHFCVPKGASGNICIICQVDEVINQTYNSGDPFLYHQHRARLLRPDPPHDLGENVDHLCHVVMRFRHLCLHLPCWPKINRICSIAGNPGSCFPWSMSEITFSFTKLCPKWLAVHLHHGCQNTRGTQVALVYHQFPGSLSHKK